MEGRDRRSFVNEVLDSLILNLGGRHVPGAWDRLCRYCGLSWSGGPPETWAFRYFDAVETDGRSSIGPVDVLCAASLHPGLSRQDLSFFCVEANTLGAYLKR